MAKFTKKEKRKKNKKTTEPNSESIKRDAPRALFICWSEEVTVTVAAHELKRS